MAAIPWWAGALALATVSVGYSLLLGRAMGVSGSIVRLVHFRATRQSDRERAALRADSAALAAALDEATRAEFGDDALGDIDPAPEQPTPPAPVPPWRVHATFIACIFVGALLASWLRGAFKLRLDLGDEFTRLVANDWRMWAVLFGGGVLVGFGTRLAGGCTSGHGLSGCARLQPGSLVATAIFFGAAVAVSLLLGAAS
jgi:hypothetical protein